MRIFWTEKRLDAVSRTALTLFQALAIATAIGGVLDKIPNQLLKIVFIIAVVMLLVFGLVWADGSNKKDRS